MGSVILAWLQSQHDAMHIPWLHEDPAKMHRSTNFLQGGLQVVLLTHGYAPRADEDVCLTQPFQEPGLECGRAKEEEGD